MNLAEDNRTVVAKRLPASAPLAPSSALQLRAEKMLVRALPQLRYRLARVGPAALSGVGVLLAAGVAAIVLLLPAHQSVLTLRDELAKAGHTHALPAAAKPELSPQQFAAALPTRAEVPALLGVLLAQAAEAGIVLEQGRYTFSPATANRLARYTFEFPVKADYGNVRNFIDRSLAAIPALGLDKLHVERKTVGDTAVSADVAFVIYLRGA
ncbi:MAG TPA: hypothetical protein VGO37_06260 [Steroidobacteraceae bacterium]|jgi:hypothetical protein|nr:hypothetical protein [Steroidobacteraceae bacterium]